MADDDQIRVNFINHKNNFFDHVTFCLVNAACDSVSGQFIVDIGQQCIILGIQGRQYLGVGVGRQQLGMLEEVTHRHDVKSRVKAAGNVRGLFQHDTALAGTIDCCKDGLEHDLNISSWRSPRFASRIRRDMPFGPHEPGRDQCGKEHHADEKKTLAIPQNARLRLDHA